MNKRHCWMVFLVIFFCTGFKLEKDMIEMTGSGTRKAPAPDEEQKPRELPPTPSFQMFGSFEDFVAKPETIQPGSKGAADKSLTAGKEKKKSGKVTAAKPRKKKEKPPEPAEMVMDEALFDDFMFDDAESEDPEGKTTAEKSER